ncbi:hypothetical protein B0H11DRAFT_2355109 [Mycena galericulata]|nr:hypothetical protein B0H11DRAFT_2355109 [Mycena galericulata]
MLEVIADGFPFVLFILTFALLGIMRSRILVDFVSNSSYTGRPQFEIGVFSVLGIFWLGTSPYPTHGGAHDRSILVWVEWLIFFFTTITTLRYSITQSNHGNKHVFQKPLSRYTPTIHSDHNINSDYPFGNNELSQYFKMD